MTLGRWLAAGGFVVLAVLLVATTAGRQRPAADPEGDVATATPALAVGPSAMGTPRATGTSTLGPSVDPNGTAEAAPSSAATPTPVPTAEPTPTDPPVAGGDPRLLYAEFLLRVNDDRATVQRLNAALSTAAGAQDPSGVHDASVDILRFVDGERAWLIAHPPAACYAKAHKAARTMLAAYGTAADRFIDWASTGGGLAGLGALGKAADAASQAGDALTAFGTTLEATSCPG